MSKTFIDLTPDRLAKPVEIMNIVDDLDAIVERLEAMKLYVPAIGINVIITGLIREIRNV